MAMRFIKPTSALLSATVSGTAIVQSTALNLGGIASPSVAWIVNVGSGLTAYFNIMVSMDGSTWYDSGEVLPTVSGSVLIFPAQYSGAFPWVMLQTTPTSGSGTVTITGFAKGMA